MRYNTTLIIVLILTTLFCLVFGIWLYKCWRRTLEAKFHLDTMEQQSELGLQSARNAKSGRAGKTGNSEGGRSAGRSRKSGKGARSGAKRGVGEGSKKSAGGEGGKAASNGRVA